MDTDNREMVARDLLTAMCLGSKARNSDWCILKGQEVLTVESAIEAMLAFEASQLSGVVGERDNGAGDTQNYRQPFYGILNKQGVTSGRR